MAHSCQIALPHYQVVSEQCLSSEGKGGDLTGCDSLPINHHIYDCGAVGLRASDLKVTKEIIPYTLRTLACTTDSQKYGPELKCADSCSIFSSPKLF